MLANHVLAIPGYRRLWTGRTVSQFGDALYYIVNIFMVNYLTRSAVVVGVYVALEFLPYLIFGPYAGTLADRIDRRKILVCSDISSGIILSFLAVSVWLLSSPNVVFILITTGLLVSVRVFFEPAVGASLPRLVPSEKLSEANAFKVASFSVVQLVGLTLSGTVLAFTFSASPKHFYLLILCLNAASFFISAKILTKLPPIVPERELKDAHPFEDFKAGLEYTRSRKDLLKLFMVLCVCGFANSPFFIAYVKANELWFGNKPLGLALMEASFFVGIIGGSVLMSKRRPSRFGIAMPLGFLIVGLTIVFMGLTQSLTWWIIWNIAAGLAWPFGGVLTDIYLQGSVEDAYRGRVQSFRQLSDSAIKPVGVLLGGIVLDRFGLTFGVVAMGIGMVLPTAAALLTPAFRNLCLPETQAAST